MRGIGIDEYIERFPEHFDSTNNSKGFVKFKRYLEENYNKKQQHILLSHHYALYAQVVKDKKRNYDRNILMNYIVMNYPEIVSFCDLMDKIQPYYKFIWTFNKQDEKLVDEIFNKLSLENKKYDVRYLEQDIIVYVINSIIECDYNEDIFHSESAHDVQQYGYKPFDRFGRRMIPHGMSWYIYGNPDTNFSDMCKLFPVRMLTVVKEKNDGWSKEGYREDLGIGFRSAWEANIARILNSKEINWKYEEEIYDLEPPRYYTETKYINVNTGKSVIYYEPDFVLEDGTIIEVKGFWDNRSKVRVSQFMEQYPDKKYLVIDTDLYYCISKKYKEIIPNWEDDNVETANDIIQVVGITLPQRKSYVAKLQVGDNVRIVREPNNEYDSRAIRVEDSEGNHIGYFAKDCNSIFAPKMDMGFEYEVSIKSKEAKVLQCRIKRSNPDFMILPDIFQ